MMVLLSLLSQKLQVPIHHLFPARGHSYNQCDRNFGVYGQKKKMTETIQTEQEYVDLIKDSRNPPFIAIKLEDLPVRDFEPKINNKYIIPKDLQISKAVKIEYFSNGTVEVYENYTSKSGTFFIEKTVSYEDLDNSPLAKKVGLSKEKVKDMKSLLPYLTPEAHDYYEQYFKKVGVKSKRED